MTVTVHSYRGSATRGALQSIDFSTVNGESYVFFQLRELSELEAMKRIATSPPLSLVLETTTSVEGKPILIARGSSPESAVLETLKTHGELLEPVRKTKSFDAWRVRSILGFGGQTLQLISSFLRPNRQVDTSVFVFAASNLAANAINLKYDHGEQVKDTHQLRYLKQRMNRELSPHLKPEDEAFSINDHRLALRPQEVHNKPLDKAKGFLERHSVAVGELGLRYLGAVGLAFPARYWKAAWQGKSIPQKDSSGIRVYTGLSSILGKTVALSSKIPDPYNPKPYTPLDWMREKCSFLLGGFIEVTSFAALAYDSFARTTGVHARPHRGLLINGKHHRDWLGGIGAGMFALGYIVRSWAKFGERNVDMPELYAHVSDTLAATTPDKIPQLLANSSASLAEHFKERQSDLNFATIYTNLLHDIQQHHAGIIARHAPTSTSKNHVNSKDMAIETLASAQPGHRISAQHASIEPAAATIAPVAR